jgi:diphthamide synthase subunit DPH2
MKITVCGSIAFYEEMEKLKTSLEAQGHEVYIPLLSNEAPAEMGGGRKIYFGQYVEDNGGIDAFPAGHPLWDLKEKAILDHYEKIKWGDAIIVSNHEKRGIAGYIGGNTLIEIGVAFFLQKPIYILNPVSSELSYKQEIYGMKPIILNGDLSLIV